MEKSKFSKYFSFILSGSILLGLIITYFLYDPFKDFIDQTFEVLISEDKDRIHEYFKQFGFWGPLAIIVFIILQMFLIVFPSWLPIIVAVMAYGFWWGVLISLSGIVIASTLGYFIGLKLKGVLLKKILGEKKMEKMDFWIQNYAFGTVVLFRISPYLSNDGISFIAGMVDMNYKKFMMATLVGIIPLAFAVGYFSQDISTLENGLYWVGGGGLVIYAIYIYFDYKKRKKS